MKITKAIQERINFINETAKIFDAKGLEPETDFGTTVIYTLYDVKVKQSKTNRVITLFYGGEKDIFYNVDELKYYLSYISRSFKNTLKYL